MLSKCLNPHCSATFRYLRQGRLFRVDFNEISRRHGDHHKPGPLHHHPFPVEHFWLCEDCAQSLSLQVNDAGEVRLVSLTTLKEVAATLAPGFPVQSVRPERHTLKATAS